MSFINQIVITGYASDLEIKQGAKGEFYSASVRCLLLDSHGNYVYTSQNPNLASCQFFNLTFNSEYLARRWVKGAKVTVFGNLKMIGYLDQSNKVATRFQIWVSDFIVHPPEQPQQQGFNQPANHQGFNQQNQVPNGFVPANQVNQQQAQSQGFAGNQRFNNPQVTQYTPPSINNSFVWDDNSQAQQNPNVNPNTQNQPQQVPDHLNMGNAFNQGNPFNVPYEPKEFGSK